MAISGFAFAVAANASYESTRWGMSISAVKKLYQGGYAEKLQNGLTSYGLVREVGGFSTAYTIFTFSEKAELKQVSILFPRQGSVVNLGTGIFEEMSRTDAEVIFKVLQDGLTSKYGRPALQGTGQAAWITGNHQDEVFLSLSAGQSDKAHATPGITYTPAPALDDHLKGL